MLSVHRATCSSQVHRHGSAMPLPAGFKRSLLLPRRHTPLTTQRNSRAAAVRPRALFYPSGGSQNLNRIAAAPPQARQALLSSAISSCRDWRQLGSLVEAYGPYLTPNNISHCLTRLEQVLAAQQLTAGEAEQVEVLLEWLLRRGREMNATAQLGPQALGATAGALARLQEAQRQQQQQQAARPRQQQQQQQPRSVRERVLEEEEAKRADAVADRRQLMQQLVDAAVAQRSRLSPQALNDILSGLASIGESGMSADEIRQLLNIQTQQQPRSRQAAAPAAQPASLAEQQAQQQVQRRQQQQQQQQRVAGPDELQKTARQLGQLSPELAQEWHDRALRQSLAEGTLPAGVDQRYLSGFLAREIDRAAERAHDTSSSSISGRAAAPSGSALLQAVLVRYGQLLGVAHLALSGHRLAELQQEGLAGTQQDVEAVASRLFQLSLARMPTADAAGLTSLISSCRELRLYSESLLSAALARAKALLQQQLHGAAGFTARQLGVVLHSLAVLGLKPSDAWLRLAVTTAGRLLPSCSLTDLERLASSLVLMRTAPGRDWTAAAEAQLEQLAAAIGSSTADPARARALVGEDDDSEEAEEGDKASDAAASNARKALVACIKSLALLGGQRATAWYRDIVAEEEARKRQQQQEEQQERLRQQQREAAAAQKQQLLQQQEQQRQQQRHRENEQAQKRQQALQQQRQAPAAISEDLLTRQLRKAMAQQQQQRGRVQQQGSNLQQQQAAATSSGSANKRELTALSSLDDMMSRALQEPDASSSSSGVQQSSLPHASTSIADATGSSSSEQASGATTPATSKPSSSSSSSSSSSKKPGKHSSAPGKLEAAAPAAWAAEQAARWADTAGEQSPAAELQQQLDDSQELFGAGSSSSSRGSRQKQQRQQQGAKQVEARDSAQEIEVQFERGATDSTRGTGKVGQQQQRSAADAASALAAMMAEVDEQDVDESAQQEVMRELGLGPDGQAARPQGQANGGDGDDDEGVMSLQEIQAAAEAVQQASQQLDELEQLQQQQQAAAQQQQQELEQHSRLQKKHRKHKQEGAAPAAAAAAKRRPLGSSGEAAFVAAAKNLSSGRPSRNYLLGCLEAIEMQQQQLKQQLAEKQALAAVAGAAQRQRAAAALDANPLAKKIAQLQQDFDNARKRAADENASVMATAVADVAAKLLPLLDSFDAALAAQLQLQQQQQGTAAAREAEQIHTVYTGLHNQLLSILKSQGVTVIGEGDDVVGRDFDPNHMEAVMRQPAPAGFADGDVLRVLRKGYAVGERLVRPALVIVAYED